MKKVVCFTYCLGSGGAERQLILLASFLKEKGYEITLLTFVKKDFYEGFVDSLGITYECIDKPKNGFFRFWHLYKRFKQLKPDVVIAYLGVPSMIACGLKMLGLKFRLICSERTTTIPIRKIDRARFILYRFTDYIVPNSKTQAENISEFKPRLKDKIKVIHNFTDTLRFTPVTKQKTDSHIRILSVGSIYKVKNVIRYINAVSVLRKECRNISFEWYGKPADMDYYNICCSMINELHLNDVFFFREPSDHIEEVYQTADIFCHPSLFEGYPNVICEAMSCGLPIICSAVCDNPSIVSEGENAILFKPECTEEIVKALNSAIALGTEGLAKMGRKSREIAISKFSKEEFVNSYITLF